MTDRRTRIFALSDVHVDFEVNARWVSDLSRADYRNDLLILAGDITHKLPELARCLSAFVDRFAKVLFVPGNHELWVAGESSERTSLQKFADVAFVAEQSGVSMRPYLHGDLLIAPLLGWYDYSFGVPNDELRTAWTDFYACRWPEGYEPDDVAAHFTRMNGSLCTQGVSRIISFSHFMPRIDLLPSYVSSRHRMLDPVLGSTRLERQLRALGSNMHVYGHSHINRRIELDGVTYINNAFGYPREEGIAARGLLCIDEL